MLKSQSKPSLSVVINTKNEAHNIVECIKSCQSIAEEIIVCDMNSSDFTQQKAKRLGAKVHRVKDYGFVEPVRQASIDRAKNDWVLVLDADERLTASLRKQIVRFLQNPQASIVRFPRKNLLFSKWIQHGMFWPDYQVRLFQKHALDWPVHIHAQPVLHEAAFSFPALEEFAIVHHHTTSLHHRLAKLEAQAPREDFYSTKKHISPTDLFERIEGEFSRRFFQHEGYKDGVSGFVAAKLMEYYRFLEFVYYWERKGYPDLISSEALNELWNLDKQVDTLFNENLQYRHSKFFHIYALLKKILLPLTTPLKNKS